MTKENVIFDKKRLKMEKVFKVARGHYDGETGKFSVLEELRRTPHYENNNGFCGLVMMKMINFVIVASEFCIFEKVIAGEAATKYFPKLFRFWSFHNFPDFTI